MRSVLILAMIISLTFLVDLPSGEAGCYEAWSRCTGWSSSATGILWKTCAGRCQLCGGRASGSCVSTTNGQCGATQYCQCSGGVVPKSNNWFDRVTCRLGL